MDEAESDLEALDDSYLWEREGMPDPEVAAFEQALAPLSIRSQRARKRSRSRALLGACAALAAALALVFVARGWQGACGRGEASQWELVSVAGEASCDGRRARRGYLAQGRWLSTEGGAALESEGVGTLELSPGTKLRVLTSDDQRQHLELARGRIAATIVAPPRLVWVDTPAATAIDMGCAYTLDVDEVGVGTLAVEAGEVVLERGSRRSIVVAGTMAEARPGRGPSAPWRSDAPTQLRDALLAFEFGDDEAALAGVLERASAADGITLWHLLERSQGSARAAVYARLRELSPPPAAIDAVALERGEAEALQRWRRAMAW